MKRIALGAAALLLAGTVASHAATITVTTTDVAWTVIDVESASYFNFDTTRNTDGLPGVEETRWGDVDDGTGNPQTIDNQSGFRFDNVALFVAPVNTLFGLGTFTHFNLPIEENTALELARLDISVNFDVDGTDSTAVFSFNVALDETTNTGAGCCDDVVSFTPLATQAVFSGGGSIFQIDLIGFYVGNTLTPNLVSPENGNSQAVLRAQITELIPEPATWGLMIAAFGLVGWQVSRRRAFA